VNARQSPRALLALSASLLTAGAVYAQPVNVQGTFTMTTYDSAAHAWTCGTASGPYPVDPTSYIAIDRGPATSLAYLFGVQIVLPRRGYTCSDGTNSVALGTATQGYWVTAMHSEDDNYPPPGIDAISPSSLNGDLTNGFTASYEWGEPGCARPNTASRHGGSFNRAGGDYGNPDWDWAQMTVAVDNTFAPRAITLKTRECLGGNRYEETVYTLTPYP